MDLLPEYILFEIFSFLSYKELIRGPFLVGKDFFNLISSSGYLLSNVMSKSLCYSKFSEMNFLKFSQISEILQKEPILLNFKGFATSGGFDGDHDLYWVGNLFKDDGSYYCSRDNKLNINTAGVLEDALEEEPESYEYILRILNDCEIVAKSIYPRFKNKTVMGPTIKKSFQQLYMVYKPQIVKIVSEQFEEPEKEVEKKIDEEVKRLKIERIDPSKFRRREYDLHVMQDSTDIVCANRSKKRAVIQEVEVSRKGNFTCPLEAFIVLCSEKYVDIEDPEFDKYNNFKTYESLIEAFPGICSPVGGDGTYLSCTFDRVASCLKPLAWGKFISRTVNEINIRLPQVVSGNYLYLKLISPDNRMSEMNDNHDHPNIDANYVIAKGWLINLAS